MNPKLLLIIGLGVGYVLGARAGREQYDAMKAQVDKVWENPRVARARRDVESYARQQAPVIRERAEAAAKAAPGVIADAAKDVAEKTTEVAKSVADSTTKTAKAVADKTTSVAKDVADRTVTTAKAVAEKATDVATDVRDSAVATASKVRDRGEVAVERAVSAAGKARDNALDDGKAPDDDEPNTTTQGSALYS